MNQVEFKFIDFKENLIQKVLECEKLSDTIFVLPTEASKNIAIREHQKLWDFHKVLFLSMEELKESLFFIDKPVLKEEKRTLAFYASLNNQDYKTFKISNYFQSLELAFQFFEMWEEFNEELIDDKCPIEKLSRQTNLLGWQLDIYSRLLSIKNQYSRFISEKGFSDPIFYYKPSFLNFDLVGEYTSLVFINQFYYTKLEKTIIERFVQAGKRVTIYYQLPHFLVNNQSKTIKPFTIQDLGAGQVEKITVFECKNDFSEFVTLLKFLDQNPIRHILNFSIFQNPYAHFLCPINFNVQSIRFFSETSLYTFFDILLKLIESIIFEKSRHQLLIPLRSCLDCLLDDIFARFIFKNNEKKAEVVDAIYTLFKDGYKYIDLRGHLLGVLNIKNLYPIHSLLDFIEKVIQIRSINDLLEFIDGPSGLKIDEIILQHENNSTNCQERFYQTLADFQSIELSAIVKDWKDVFGQSQIPDQIVVSAGLFRLFLSYLKNRPIQYNFESAEFSRFEFASILDTRNVTFKNIVITDVIEGSIPRSHNIPFLFTENQRKIMGLKTFEDIKLREKYYFFRLLLTCSQVVIFTKKNLDQNIEKSSFLEEVELFFPKEKLEYIKIQAEQFCDVYYQILVPNRYYSVNTNASSKMDFYALPVDIEQDFPQNRLDLSYYAIQTLLDNSFLFFVRFIAKLDELPKTIEYDFSNVLIGNFVHDVLNRFWADVLKSWSDASKGIDFNHIDFHILTNAVEKTLNSERFYYLLSHNFSDIYFKEIVLPRILEGIHAFFDHLHRLGLSNKQLIIYPENMVGQTKEPYLPLLSSKNGGFQICIGGRADLRLELTQNQQFYIFDYKTGGFNREQLISYELYYYLIERPELLEKTFSYFIQILEGYAQELRDFNRRQQKEEIIDSFKQSIRDKLNDIWTHGFRLPEQKSKLERMAELTRKDLFLIKQNMWRNPRY